MEMSSSRLAYQLDRFRLVLPTRAHVPSMRADLACSMVPSHSNTRTPASSSWRYCVRDTVPIHLMSEVRGTSIRTSTPAAAAFISACVYMRVGMK